MLVCYMPLARSRLAALWLRKLRTRDLYTRRSLEAAPRGLLSAALHAAF